MYLSLSKLSYALVFMLHHVDDQSQVGLKTLQNKLNNNLIFQEIKNINKSKGLKLHQLHIFISSKWNIQWIANSLYESIINN